MTTPAGGAGLPMTTPAGGTGLPMTTPVGGTGGRRQSHTDEENGDSSGEQVVDLGVDQGVGRPVELGVDVIHAACQFIADAIDDVSADTV